VSRDLPKPPRVSELLTATLQAWPEERISFGALVDATQGRGFGALVVLVSLPCLIPLPVGFSGPLFGGMLCLMAAQMIVGFEHPWLPAWVRRISMTRESVERFVHRLDPWLHRLERLCHPTWPWALTKNGQRVVGGFLILTGIALSLPVPLTNIPIALVMIGYGVGLMERDGRLLILMELATTVICISFGLLGDQIWAQIDAMLK
jgi:hypothetical protein